MRIKITFIQEGSNDIIVEDEILEPISNFTERLSSILSRPNIVTVQFKSASLILKPSRVISIKVEQLENIDEDCIVDG